jgi:hypothetical protein
MEKITKKTTKIETEFMGTFHKALATPDFTYFCNYEEGDMNGNTKMYRNSDGTLVSDNYHGGQDFMRALQEDEHIFISNECKEELPLIAEAEMTEITGEVFLGDFDGDEEFTVYVNEEETHFFAVSESKKHILRYKINKAIKDLTKEEKEATLYYRYSNLATEEMEVEFDDIFMEGKHIELIK